MLTLFIIRAGFVALFLMAAVDQAIGHRFDRTALAVLAAWLLCSEIRCGL